MEMEYEKKGFVGKNLDCNNLANHLGSGNEIDETETSNDSDDNRQAFITSASPGILRTCS
jgi:hypothetical protein